VKFEVRKHFTREGAYFTGVLGLPREMLLCSSGSATISLGEPGVIVVRPLQGQNELSSNVKRVDGSNLIIRRTGFFFTRRTSWSRLTRQSLSGLLVSTLNCGVIRLTTKMFKFIIISHH